MPDKPWGPDVASYQGRPNWEAVKAAGASFAFIKATEGIGYVHPNLTYDWDLAKINGLYRGAYHFARPGMAGAAPEDEAWYFLEAMEASHGLDIGDLVALDLEANHQSDMPVDEWAWRWISAIHDAIGYWPLLYTGPWFVAQEDIKLPQLGNCGLWYAGYGPRQPDPPPMWEFVAFWQYTDRGQVPGIVGGVDLNFFNGAADRIPLYGKPSPDDWK